MTKQDLHQLTLSEDVALVLFDMLARSDGAIQSLAPGERAALWQLEAGLERLLAEPFAAQYDDLLAAARSRLSAEGGGESLPTPRVCYVDVDDTLVRSFGSKRIPMGSMVERVRELRAAGMELYCWSSGGAAYAFRSAKELGLENCFSAYLPKPQLMIDDQPPADWRDLACLHPNEAASRSAEELMAPPVTRGNSST